MSTNTDTPDFFKTQRLYVLWSGIFGLTLLMGIARFAYTPMLVLIQEQSNLSDSMGAILASINYVGYLSGALIAASISNMQLKDTLYRTAIIVGIISTAMMAATDNVWVWGVSRYFAGLSSAGGLLISSGLVMNWLIRHQFKSELGIYLAGVGTGIAFTSIIVELLQKSFTSYELWWLLTGLGAICAIPAWRWLPRPKNAGQTIAGNELKDNPPSTIFLRVFMAAYFLAGAGYVVSATFIVAIVEQLQPNAGNWAFIVLGLGAMPAPIIWDKVASITSDFKALLMTYILQVISIAIPLFAYDLTSLLVSSVMFGFSFVGAVSLVLSIAGRYYPSRPAKMMGKMTLSYGVAQILAPAIIAAMAVGNTGYQQGLWLALIAMLIGTGLIIILMKLEKSE